MPANSITIIFSPYHVGILNHRVGGGPIRIRNHGVVEELQNLGIKVNVVELGNVDEFEGEIGRSFELLRRTSSAVSEAIAASSFPIVLSGNCMASAGVAAGLGIRDLGFIWLDAHDDLDTPSDNVNGYLDAMGVSILSGQSWHALAKSIPGHEPQSLDRFVYCGLRDVSDVQRKKVEEAKVAVVWGKPLQKTNFTAELAAILDRKAMGPALVHLDLDVLDESLGKVNDYPSPGGFYEADLNAIMNIIPSKVLPTSLTVCSFDPEVGDGDKIAKIAVGAIGTFAKSLLDAGVVKC